MAATLKNSTAGLYNTMCSELHLSDKQFQMTQGALPVQARPSGLYNFFDGIPPKSVAVLYTANPLNGLDGNMQNIIEQAPEGFIKTIAYNQFMDERNWIGGRVGVNPIYAPPFDDIKSQVDAGSAAVFNFNSTEANTSLQSSWADDSSSGGVWFWGTSSGSSTKDINTKASSSEITIDFNFNRYAYLTVRAGGWFSQGLFTKQYQNPKTWSEGGQAGWDKIFGPKGSCQRVANQALLVKGYTIKVTSHASYSADEYEKVTKDTNTNVWPFYTSSSSSSTSTRYTHNSDKSITTTLTLGSEYMQIFGMGVVPVNELIQGVGPHMHSRQI